MVGAHIGLGPLPASQAVKCDRAVEYDPSPLGVSALTQNDLEGVVMQHEPCSLISPQRQLRVPGTDHRSALRVTVSPGAYEESST